MPKIRMIERNYLSYKTRPKKLKIRRARELVNAVSIGWKIRKQIRFVKSLDSLKEVMDLVKLSGDL